MNAPTLGELLHGFFEDHLKCQKGLRLTSVRSYRDGMSLFLQSVAKQCGRKLSALTITDLKCERVIAFLNELETERHNHNNSISLGLTEGWCPWSDRILRLSASTGPALERNAL
jgi:hypothetical protein